MIPRLTLWRLMWAAPCSAVGLLLAVLLWPLGARTQRVQGVLEVAIRPTDPPRAWRAAVPFTAITLGHVVIGLSPQELHRLRTHERVHVAQYERWGLLFFVGYPLASLWQLLRGRRAYWDNPFEVQARLIEGRMDDRSQPQPAPSAAGRDLA